MKKIFVLFFFLYALNASASITLKGVSFNDYEESSSNYLISFFPRQTFLDLGFTTTKAGYVLTCRDENNANLTCVSNKGLVASDLRRIRERSYLIDWSLVTNSLGVNQRDYNSLMALSGALFGFVFLLFMVFTAVNISRRHF